jgi:Rrf2 family nitric oxide-sensitive transcriptional repressor
MGGYAIRLTAYTNYSLRTLMFCAIHPGQIVRIEDIANAFGISKAHLLKSARQMGQLGYLKTIRGRSGGVQLGMAAERISIGEVVRALEGNSEVVECFNPATNTCPLIGECKMTALFHRGLEAFFSELDRVTLADITKNPEALRDRLPVLELV